MEAELAVLVLVTALVSTVLTYLTRRHAIRKGRVDIPNARSSHVTPTPRGGGLGIVAAANVGIAVLSVTGRIGNSVFVALLGGLAVAIVGSIDDARGLSARARLGTHFVAAAWALGSLGGLPPVQVGERLVNFGPAGYLLGALGIVWMINLFNFMDGIDGLAGSECVFISCAGAFLASVAGLAAGIPDCALLFAAACGGFLVWNWPPARIFMGDVGSGYVGYVVAVLALASTRENGAALWVWLILGAAFIVDATVTLVRRILRGERIYEAHRSHAYQWLARRWRSHLRATTALIALNLLWLFPAAWLAAAYPASAIGITAIALAPVVILAIVVGAGRREAITARKGSKS